MKKLNRFSKKIFSNKVISIFFIPIILFVFYFSSSIFLNNKISFSVLTYVEKNSDFKGRIEGKILKAKEIKGEFKARQDYLGLILIRFGSYIKPDFEHEDKLLFRLKEKGSKNVIYSHEYKSGLFENVEAFPFGFTPISNSYGKTYEFSIKSLSGNSNNAVSFNSNETTLISGYQIPKSVIVSGKIQLFHFLLNRSISSFTDLSFIVRSALYFLPLYLYFLIFLYFKKNKFLKRFLFTWVILLIISDIFILKDFYLGIWFTIIFSWIIAVLLYKMESSVTFLCWFLLMLFWILTMFLKINIFSDKLNILSYTFLLISVFQFILEERYKYKSKIDYEHFIAKLKKLF